VPVINSGDPTVSVQVPVPQPVQQKPRSPVTFRAPPPQPAPEAGPTGVPPVAPAAPPSLSAVILPWSPPAQGQPTQMSRVRYAKEPKWKQVAASLHPNVVQNMKDMLATGSNIYQIAAHHKLNAIVVGHVLGQPIGRGLSDEGKKSGNRKRMLSSIHAMRAAGKTHQEIATHHGISRQRVAQLLRGTPSAPTQLPTEDTSTQMRRLPQRRFKFS